MSKRAQVQRSAHLFLFSPFSSIIRALFLEWHEELVTERLHEIHKIYGPNTLRDIADRLKHSIDIDVEIAIGHR